MDSSSFSNLPEDLRRMIETVIAEGGVQGDLAQLNKVLQGAASGYNDTPQEELQGYSPAMCYALRHRWNTPGSPVQFNSGLSLEQLTEAKTFHVIRRVLLAVREAGGVKATATGNFNRKFVESMVDVLLEPAEREFLLSYHKTLNETDFHHLNEGHLVAKAAGLLLIRRGVIRTTRKYEALLEDSRVGELFSRLFDAYYRIYNVSYGYRYSVDVDWIQHEIRFLLYPLSLKAKSWIPASSLPGAILHPHTLARLEDALSGQQFMDSTRVVERYFVRPLLGWGFLEAEWSDHPHYRILERIRTRPLFDQFFRFDTNPE